MCADCWGVKDPVRAKRWLNSPRRQPLVDPRSLLWGLGAAVAVVLVALYAVTQWI
jgi:hypothetical protein